MRCARFLARLAVPNETPRNAAEFLNAKIGVELTDLLFRPYTLKMWGMQLEEMAAALVQRIPDPPRRRGPLFPRRLPSRACRAVATPNWCARILDHPAIRVSTNVAFSRDMLREL